MDIVVKTLDILRIQRNCIQRMETCDHVCSECELNLPIKAKLKALNTAIALIDAEKNIRDLMNNKL